jgi:pectate disaccharide-lyase
MSGLLGQVGGGLAAPQGNTYYVAKTGSDANPGTFERPWLTLTKAAAVMLPGDVTLVRVGTYAEEVEFVRAGAAGAWITLQAYPGESVLIDGTGHVEAVSFPNGTDYCQVVGLGITNPTKYGIQINRPSHINILNCEIYDCGWDGILSVNGGGYYVIQSNVIHDCGHLGEHYEGMGIMLYNAGSYSRVDGNLVYNCFSSGIEAYNTPNIQITNNVVFSCAWLDTSGFGINPCGGANDALVTGNRIFACANGGILVDGDTNRVRVADNLVYGNGDRTRWGSGIWVGGTEITGCTYTDIFNNTVVDGRHEPDDGSGMSNGRTTSTHTSWRNNILKNNKDHNFYTGATAAATLTEHHNNLGTPGDADDWLYAGTTYTTDQLAAYQVASGKGVNDQVGNPLFDANYGLLPGSPCLGAGVDLGYGTNLGCTAKPAFTLLGLKFSNRVNSQYLGA